MISHFFYCFWCKGTIFFRNRTLKIVHSSCKFIASKCKKHWKLSIACKKCQKKRILVSQQQEDWTKTITNFRWNINNVLDFSRTQHMMAVAFGPSSCSSCRLLLNPHTFSYRLFRNLHTFSYRLLHNSHTFSYRLSAQRYTFSYRLSAQRYTFSCYYMKNSMSFSSFRVTIAKIIGLFLKKDPQSTLFRRKQSNTCGFSISLRIRL